MTWFCVFSRDPTTLIYLIPLPLPTTPPLPTPLPALPVPVAAPPLATPPLPIPLPTLPILPLPPALPRPGIEDCLDPGGAEYLLTGFTLVGGFSTNEVSVVRNVASISSPLPPPILSRKGEFCSCDCVSLCRANDCGIGAYNHHTISPHPHPLHRRMVYLTSGKSTQKALIFNPYKNAPKFSLNLPRLSFSSCRCMKLASRSAMLSLSSAKAGSRVARISVEEVEVEPLGVVWEARRLVREGGRRGVVGREGRRVREVLRCWEEGAGAGVVEAIGR